MSTRPWHFGVNQFDNATKKNYKKAVKLSIFHDAKLKKRKDDNPGDADYTLAYGRYHPLHLALVAAYNDWKSKGGSQTGDTLNLDQLLALMTGKINLFDDSTKVIYRPDTPQYQRIWNGGHKPFNANQQIDSRIDAVNTLSINMGADPLLNAIKLLVDGYYTQLNNARILQDGGKDATTTGSTAVETARLTAMTGQYQNTGLFINKFPTQPAMMESLFDTETLTNPEQTIWKGHLNPLEDHPVLIHTFMAGDTMRLKSNGHADIDFYLASTPGGRDSTRVSIIAEHQQTIDVSAFAVADFSVNKYLTVINTSATTETRFLVELY